MNLANEPEVILRSLQKGPKGFMEIMRYLRVVASSGSTATTTNGHIDMLIAKGLVSVREGKCQLTLEGRAELEKSSDVADAEAQPVTAGSNARGSNPAATRQELQFKE